MKENHNKADLVEDLNAGRRIDTQQGWFELVSIKSSHLSSTKNNSY
ncbi:hypothetical protein [Leptospira alexanderi]|nr:hypothetical protein [Leptospira alexanderi]